MREITNLPRDLHLADEGTEHLVGMCVEAANQGWKEQRDAAFDRMIAYFGGKGSWFICYV